MSHAGGYIHEPVGQSFVGENGEALSGIGVSDPMRNFLDIREKHSMDQYRSRPKLAENFERHWSIRISGEIHMDKSIGPYLFLGKFVWTNGPESSSKVSPYTGIGPWMVLPRT